MKSLLASCRVSLVLNAAWRALFIGFMLPETVGDRGRVEVVAEEGELVVITALL